MDIKEIRNLIIEHDRLSDIIKTINKASSQRHYIKIITPENREGEYLNQEHIDLIFKESRRRCIEIEEILESKEN